MYWLIWVHRIHYHQLIKREGLWAMSTTQSQNTDRGIPYEVDGEVIYLDALSAEGKAIERTRNPIPEEEWIAVGEIGSDIDMEAVRERTRQRGYKVQVSSED